MRGAVVKSFASSVAMTAAGAAAGFGVWVATMYALIPFLLFAALGAAPFVALIACVLTAAVTAVRPCHAPAWAQRHKLAFWVGTFAALTYVCASIAIATPQAIPFWPHG